tara:strand:- start:1778 stop:2026 length:249 start_codon:yes stop_codon:yes gene_type:complete
MAFIRDEKEAVETVKLKTSPTVSLKVANPSITKIGDTWETINVLWANVGTEWTNIASSYNTILSSPVTSTRVVNPITTSVRV